MGFRWSGVQIPPARPNRTHFRKQLSRTPSPRSSPVSAEVSNRASNSCREETVSRRLERSPLQDEALYRDRCMDLKNLISRIEIAALGAFNDLSRACPRMAARRTAHDRGYK